MPKISELVPDDQLGKVKIRIQHWKDQNRFFVPYFKCKVSNVYFGLDDNIGTNWPDSDDWVLFIEPKAKVKRWLWAYKCENHGWKILDGFFSEQEAIGSDKIVYIKIKKLDWSEQEFDE